MENNSSGTTADPLGGLVIGQAGPSTGSGAPAASVSASASIVEGRKRRSDAGQPRGSRGAAATASVPAISQTQFAQLYSPALWEKAVCAPADAMQAISGNRIWEVSPKEREAVGASCSIAAQCFAVTDPRWLAAALAFITVLDVYGVRMAIYLSEKKAAREEAERKRKEAANR